jgi:hypothetical protein
MISRLLSLSLATGLLAAVLPVSAETPPAPAAPPAEPVTPAAPAAPVLDFGDFSSETITTKAWEAYNAKNFPVAKGYAGKCIELYQAKAVEMQKALTAPATEKLEVHKSWALNDVGTSYLILGQSLEAEGKAKEAVAAFKFLTENLSYAQCWDAKGWFWKPAEAARERVKALEFELLE